MVSAHDADVQPYPCNEAMEGSRKAVCLGLGTTLTLCFLPGHVIVPFQKICEPWEKSKRIAGYDGEGQRIYCIPTGSSGRVGALH